MHPISRQNTIVGKDELFLHVTPLPYESPADALTRNHSLSPRDIDTIAHHVRTRTHQTNRPSFNERQRLICSILQLKLDLDQRQKIPRRCCPVDLQHHIQTELMRRVHLGIDIGAPHDPSMIFTLKL
jgi:hypothetical protein